MPDCKEVFFCILAKQIPAEHCKSKPQQTKPLPNIFLTRKFVGKQKLHMPSLLWVSWAERFLQLYQCKHSEFRSVCSPCLMYNIWFMPASGEKLYFAVMSIFILLSFCYRVPDGLFWSVKYKSSRALLDKLLYIGRILCFREQISSHLSTGNFHSMAVDLVQLSRISWQNLG